MNIVLPHGRVVHIGIRDSSWDNGTDSGWWHRTRCGFDEWHSVNSGGLWQETEDAVTCRNCLRLEKAKG